LWPETFGIWQPRRSIARECGIDKLNQCTANEIHARGDSVAILTKEKPPRRAAFYD
jgi:hypothetical protein